MNVCDECGMSMIGNGLHSPFCSHNNLSDWEKEEVKSNVESSATLISAIYESVSERAKKLLRIQMKGSFLKEAGLTEDSSKDNILQKILREALEKELEKALTHPMVDVSITASSMLTLQVLLEQGYLNEETISRDLKDLGDNGGDWK